MNKRRLVHDYVYRSLSLNFILSTYWLWLLGFSKKLPQVGMAESNLKMSSTTYYFLNLSQRGITLHSAQKLHNTVGKKSNEFEKKILLTISFKWFFLFIKLVQVYMYIYTISFHYTATLASHWSKIYVILVKISCSFLHCLSKLPFIVTFSIFFIAWLISIY